ncbi:MAG: ribonuclease J [Clostridium sp.]|nr:ribonuclease J [Clostridium sp.]
MNNKNKKSNVKVIPLGGIGEIGKNITVIEYDDEIIVIDCGLTFPDTEMYGIDLVIPDITYLLNNREKVKGIFITHGHEDHIGALPYVLKQLNVPVYATKFPLSLIKSKLEEHNILSDCTLNEVSVNDTIKTDHFAVEFIRTCHSISDSCSLSITTPQGIIFHTGDFKIDYTPLDGKIIDLQRYAAIGKKHVLLLMADSTNVERPGYTISEKVIGDNLTRLFRNARGRVIVATFSSNISRIQQIINSSLIYKRKVAFSGRSMEKISEIAIDLGYLTVPKNTIISLDDANNYPPEKVTIITTGTQGEPMSALSRIANDTHRKISIQKDDYIIISASPIPGNKKSISRVIDILINRGAEVIYDQAENIHVSGHACQEELKLIQSLIKPKYFMPVHGEFRHLKLHKSLAESMGTKSDNIFIMENGNVLELNRKKARITETVHTDSVFVDGSGVGDVGRIVMRDRKTLATSGILNIVVGINKESKTMLSRPSIFSRGFVYVKDSPKLMSEVTSITEKEIQKCFDNNITDWHLMKSAINQSLGKFLYAKTKRKPMIIPIIIEQ